MLEPRLGLPPADDDHADLGTAFIMWLGEQVTERGIGNGISLIIFSGIIVGIPSGLSQLIEMIRTDQFTPLGAILLFLPSFVA